MKKTDISPAVRRKVLERDSYDGCPCCIVCGTPLPSGGHLHHMKSRGAGGEGIPENLVTLCWKCHAKYHNGDMDVHRICKSYLEEKYGDYL